MRIMMSTAALAILIIAAALEAQDDDVYDSEISGYLESEHQFRPSQLNLDVPLRSKERFRPSRFHYGFHHPADCCFSYTAQKIRCKNMRYSYETSSACFLPAVIFVTKKGQRVCADPRDLTVQICKFNLTQISVPKNLERLKRTLELGQKLPAT
ncbi:C-C motif chemokine 15-like isoform X1 [Octodon degus]|uniref:C-C motif chemokine 15-like isoform X1 n=1 Tax=Octodon degus TaxID=10160 RepID=A0A6P3FRH2_OCTDE|nr:C-C motif chemokine 15-like isoform X1 [Octodon degus]XP_023558876.1 C-C motif chemokine 15-like isoform X1 [Octodon degus]XP_023558878.1 C-C motif chemokine 15-like isoform X1 [Octodon degus]